MQNVHAKYVSQDLLNIWIYQFLLGSLPEEKFKLLEAEIRKRDAENKIFSELERKLLASLTSSRGMPISLRIPASRNYLTEVFRSDEKRKFGS